MLFQDRREAGRLLARRLQRYGNRQDTLVLALPRGGVPVGFEVAAALRAALDVFVVRKLGVPQFKELAMGAIATGGICVINDALVQSLGIPAGVIDAVATKELKELKRRQRLYCGDRRPSDAAGKVVILVDDGLATGASMRAAARAVKKMQPASVIAALPIAAEESLAVTRPEIDELVCLDTPKPFYGVGAWYRDFEQTSDDEVRRLIEENAAQQRALDRERARPPSSPTTTP